MESVTRALKDDMNIERICCWTDSKVTLSWIKSTKEFRTFVQNRVLQIRKNVVQGSWYYCSSQDNPADVITRDNNIPNYSLWWKGPSFLYNDNMPALEDTDFGSEETPGFQDELKVKNSSLVVSVITPTSVGNIIDVNRYNDLMKLFRITAYVIRFISNIKAKINGKALCLSKYVISRELIDARLIWIKENQSTLDVKYYDDSKVNLNLKKDEFGVVRSFSRLKHADMPFDTKAPILINTKHKLAELIVYYFHSKVLHRGIKQTLTEIRVSYWIPRGRSYVKKLLYSCVVCRKINTRSYEYPGHSDLPKLRFDDRHPYSTTGVDALGPLYCLPVYGDEQRTYKAWVMLYTCAATRAIVLDVVHDMRAHTFVSSFLRFISRRGCPNTVISDNGSSFTAIETQEFAASRYIDWKFNLEGAAWFSGMWERLVGSVKRYVIKVVRIKTITFVELQTVIFEIELILNNRPIDAEFEDDYQDVLTPNHMVFGRRLESVNEVLDSEVIHGTINLRRRKRVVEIMLDHFWNRWRREYLTSLRETQRRTSKGHSLKIQLHDIVLVHEEKQPRHCWKLGRVVKLIPSDDGEIRGAEIDRKDRSRDKKARQSSISTRHERH